MTRQHTDREYEGELQQAPRAAPADGRQGRGDDRQQRCGRWSSATASSPARMIDFDDQINRLEVEIDDLCLRILARRQPVASDLRFITIALKIVTDLERIGDLGVNICERVIELNAEPPLKPYLDLPRMAEAAQGMVREALDAFVAGDADRAPAGRSSATRWSTPTTPQIFRELLTYMMEDPRNIYRATRVQSIAQVPRAHRRPRHQPRRDGGLHGQGQGHPPPGQARASRAPRCPTACSSSASHNSARSQMAEGWARKLTPGSGSGARGPSRPTRCTRTRCGS